jgi:hypothetical protein
MTQGVGVSNAGSVSVVQGSVVLGNKILRLCGLQGAAARRPLLGVCGIGCAVLALLAVASTARAELAAEVQGTGPQSLFTSLTAEAALEESQQVAAELYAREQGVSLERARAILAMQARAAGLQETLRNALGSSFGEVWFDNKATQVVVDIGPGASQSAAQSVLGQFGLSDESRVEQKPWNEADLSDEVALLTARLSAYIRAGEAQVGIAANEEVQVSIAGGVSSANQVAIERAATNPQVAESSGGAAEGTSPNVVTPVVRISGQPSFNGGPAWASPGDGGPPLIAGMYYANVDTSCTLGFEVSSPESGNPYYLTAGHCIDAGVRDLACLGAGNTDCSYYGSDIGGFVGSGGDAGVVEDTSSSWPGYPAFIDWDCCGDTLPVYGVTSAVANEFVCHTGYASAAYGEPGTSCGEVKEVGIKFYYKAPWDTWVTLDKVLGSGLCGYHGDSGGPVFSPVDAYALGVFDYITYPKEGEAGACGWADYFSNAGQVAGFLGVSIDVY